MLQSGHRLVAQARDSEPELCPYGLNTDRIDLLDEQLESLRRMLTSPRAQKHDTSLQMKSATLVMSQARGWLRTLRLIAGLNLAGDTPALHRLASPEPELLEGYPRDLVSELELRLKAANDLAPRLVDAGLNRKFLSAGRKLATQLRTAVGPRDLRPEDLELEVRRLYLRKGQIYLELKRWARLGQLVFMADPNRVQLWNLSEMEPHHPFLLPPSEHNQPKKRS